MLNELLFTNWHMMRWIRLGLAIALSIQAFEMHFWLVGAFAGLILYQVATNTTCCAASDCDVPSQKNKTDNVNDIEYEEIKTK